MRVKTEVVTINCSDESKNGDYIRLIQADKLVRKNKVYCSNCKVEILPFFVFCPCCGAYLEDVEPNKYS